MTIAIFNLISTFTMNFVIVNSNAKLGARSKQLITWRLIYRGVATTFGLLNVTTFQSSTICPMQSPAYVGKCGAPPIAIQPDSTNPTVDVLSIHTVADEFTSPCGYLRCSKRTSNFLVLAKMNNICAWRYNDAREKRTCERTNLFF